MFRLTFSSAPDLFGLTPIVTTSIASGTFLVGSGSAVASEIRDRMGMTVEISTQRSDYFTRNMIAIRAEKRAALVSIGRQATLPAASQRRLRKVWSR